MAGDGTEEGRAVIAVPVYRPRLSAEERISARHLLHFLGRFPIRLVMPEGLASPLPGLAVERFPAACFASTDTYSRLLLSAEFYRRFAGFEFLLIHQLDCLVFSPELEPWCDAGFDYLGAPWLRDPERPEAGFSRVGNGGLSLRRVAACLAVLTSRRRGPEILARGLLAPLPDLAGSGPGRRGSKRLEVLREARRGAAWYAARYSLNEDRFWADRAHLFAPFHRPMPRQALPFAFECAPRYCHERNGRRLPFGCHGWWRWDRAFWEPHLLPAAVEEAARG